MLSKKNQLDFTIIVAESINLNHNSENNRKTDVYISHKQYSYD